MRETKNISFTPEQAQFVDQRVEEGRYQSASEMVREGLRLLEQREREQAARIDAMRSMILQGVDELDRGESLDGPQTMREARARLTDRASKLSDAS